jgi:hypothetical protein
VEGRKVRSRPKKKNRSWLRKEETPKEDLTAQAKPAETEKQVVSEAKPVEEAKPAEKPAEKPVEEAKPAEEKKSPWIAINDLPKDDKRPQEEDHPVCSGSQVRWEAEGLCQQQ